MKNIEPVAQDTIWIGGNDHGPNLFENMFPLPDGMSYNSYVVLDEKTVLFDTADVTVADQYLANLKEVLGERVPDYLVILHMEPDHCSQLEKVLGMYPDLTVVSSAQTFRFIGQFFPGLKIAKQIVVKEGAVLETGAHRFRFIAAPQVHWPEVMFAFDEATGALFSADAFGTFGAVENGIFADEYDFEAQFLDEARRYYANIVGKFGANVQTALKKTAGLDIQRILPLHGPVWRDNLSWFLDKYQLWSTYTPESEDILVIYGSMYGHTRAAAEQFAAALSEVSGKKTAVYDVSRTDISNLISEVWRCGKVVIFCPTYNAGIYPPVDRLIEDMKALNVQNRTFAVAENGTWGPVAGKLVRGKLSELKNCTVVEKGLTIRSALSGADAAAFDAFVSAAAQA